MVGIAGTYRVVGVRGGSTTGVGDKGGEVLAGVAAGYAVAGNVSGRCCPGERYVAVLEDCR